MEISELIPDDIPDWAIEAMARGQLFTVTFNRIKELEGLRNSLAVRLTVLERTSKEEVARLQERIAVQSTTIDNHVKAEGKSI